MADFVAVLIIVGIIVIFMYVFSGVRLITDETDMYVSVKDSDDIGTIYRRTGKGIETPCGWRIPLQRMERVSRYLFIEKELVGAKYIGEDILPMDEEYFESERGIKE